LSTNKKTLKLYWQQVRKHKVSFFLMLFCIPVGVLFIDTLLPYFLSQAIGGLAEQKTDITQQNLIFGAIVGVIGAIINFVGFRSMSIHEADVIADLREDTFSKLINKDQEFFSNQKIGAMTSRFIDFVRSEVSIQDLAIIRTFGFVLSVGGGVIILATQSLVAAGIILLLIVGLLLQVRWSAKKRAPWRHERKELVSEIHGAAADTLTNNVIVKTFAAEDREIKHLNKLTDRFRKIYKKDIGFVSAEGSARVAIMTVVQIVAIGVAASMASSGTISLATAIFMLAYLQRIGSQLFVLGDIINGYDQAFLDAAPMTEMLHQEDIVKDKSHAVPLELKTSDITFNNVSYHYADSEEKVLKNLSLTIPTGQKIGLVGHSGAGKTTITQLLLRFSDVTDGVISIGGQDLRDVTQHSLREHIAYVPQEPMLFHRTLRENIAYGNPDATDDEVRDAAEKAYATEFIDKLPHGFETTVGERGVKLSGGQRQRIAVARAILKDAPILVLDEATSALDSESEKLIQQSLETLMKGRTSIVIAHRLSTIAKLDRIIVMDQGKIVEDGSHKELLEKGGIYANLWNHQSGGFIEE
jgi:ATP-binding cassette, subfamily B, bacterial